MKCTECEKEGMKSIVYEGQNYTTTAYYIRFFDDAGRRHHHDGNVITTSYTCSNGHKWEEKTINKCWCGWPDNNTTEEL